MRRPTIRYAQYNVPVQCVSERYFLFPDADEKYTPDVKAYIQSYDFQLFEGLLGMLTPEAVVASFQYLSDLEKSWCLRALFEHWSQLLAEGWQGEPLPPHLLQWIARKKLNGDASRPRPPPGQAAPGEGRCKGVNFERAQSSPRGVNAAGA